MWIPSSQYWCILNLFSRKNETGKNHFRQLNALLGQVSTVRVVTTIRTTCHRFFFTSEKNSRATISFVLDRLVAAGN
jgi:hypothetical protein